MENEQFVIDLITKKVVEKDQAFYLPINKLDDIDINVIVFKDNNNNIYFRISSTNIINRANEFEIYFISKKFENVYSLVVYIKENINNFKFSKYNGRFIVEQKYEKYELLRSYFNSFFDCSAKCSVCLEDTLTETACNHPLCYRCREKILKNVKEDNLPTCPVCRETIEFN
jgi:hypothetical protein